MSGNVTGEKFNDDQPVNDILRRALEDVRAAAYIVQQSKQDMPGSAVRKLDQLKANEVEMALKPGFPNPIAFSGSSCMRKESGDDASSRVIHCGVRGATVFLFISACVWAQLGDPKARELYYSASSAASRHKETAVPSQTLRTTGGNKKSPTTTPAHPAVTATPPVTAPPIPVPGASTQPSHSDRQSPVIPAALHFGLRYNLLKIDQNTNTETEIDPDTNLRTGDCVAVRLQPNRPGYLYVFNSGASGAWQALLPSLEMPDESNRVEAGAPRRVPAKYCFAIDSNRGVESMLIVVSETERDFYELNNAMRGLRQPEENSAPRNPPRDSAGVQIAESLAGGQPIMARDLIIGRVTTPQAPGEPPESVYVVRPASTNAPIAIEVKIRHE